MQLTDFKVLTFDCYGTLIDWETGMIENLRPLTDKVGDQLTRDAILEAHARHESFHQAQTPGRRYSDILSTVYLRLAEEWGVEVARVYDCGGVTVDVRASTNPVIRHLIQSGIARPDVMRIGIDVDDTCALIAADGAISQRIRVVGPLTRGRYFEIEAIPDIRVQAAAVAQNIIPDGQAPGRI